jgi:uncharacterized membrane protein YbhN (UPF0104 family)
MRDVTRDAIIETGPRMTATPLPRSVAAGVAEPLPGAVAPGRLRRALALLAAAVVFVVAAIALLPGVGDLRARFLHAGPGWIALAVVLEVASALCYVLAFRLVFCARMSWSASYRIAMSELGANSVLPAGGAGGLVFGAWALRRGGMPSEQIAKKTVAFFLLTSVPNVGLLIALGLALSVGLVPGHVGLALAVIPAVVATAAVAGTLWLGRTSSRAQRRATAAAGFRGKVLLALRATADGVGDATGMLRRRDPRLLGGLIGYLAFDILVLSAAFAALGSAPPIAVLGVAYLIGQLGNLVPLPGGIGGVEGGLIGALVVYGVKAVPATAAVLLYRALQLWIPAGLGAIAFFQLHSMLRQETTEIALCQEGETVEILGRGPVMVGRTPS